MLRAGSRRVRPGQSGLSAEPAVVGPAYRESRWSRTRRARIPRSLASSRCPTARRCEPAFQLLDERVKEYTPEWAAEITGIPAATIRRLAHEMGVTARDQKIELPIPWTDCWGVEHETVTGNPVAFHAMRGLAAHSNGFHTIRALGDPDVAARHHRPPRAASATRRRFRARFRRSRSRRTAPKPCSRIRRSAGWRSAGRRRPDDLFVDDAGKPVRIDKAFSWEYPLSVHGLMHNVITNAWRGDPYRIDTLMIFMANMAWNSTMNTVEVRKMLNDRDENRRVQDPVPGRVRCVPVGDDRVRRPGAARHHLPRAPRRDVDARPADLGVRRAGGFGARSGGAAERRVQAVPGGADRAGGPAEASGVRARRRHAQVPRLSGFHRQLRNRAGLGHRLSGRLARQRRREVDARRAQPEAVGDVRQEQLRLPLSSCRRSYQYMRNWNKGYHGVGAARRGCAATASRS